MGDSVSSASDAPHLKPALGRKTTGASSRPEGKPKPEIEDRREKAPPIEPHKGRRVDVSA